MRFLKQSTSVDVPIGPFLDDADGKTAETALTLTQPDIRLKKNAGAWAQKNAAQTLSHEENGYYEVTLDATDTDTLGLLRLAVHESGALSVWEEFMVMPANVWDSLLGSDRLEIDVAQFGGTNLTASAGRPEVNTTHAAGTAWGSGAITAASIAADAITAAKIADGAIDAATFAAGAIDAAAIAADAIGSSELAATAASEIATAERTELTTELGRIDAATSTRATPAQVNTEVLDVLNTDTFAEPGQEAPPATTTLVKKIGYLYKFLRNKKTQTATTLSIFADDGSTVDQKATISDDGTTYTHGEVATGP